MNLLSWRLLVSNVHSIYLQEMAPPHSVQTGQQNRYV